MSHARESGPPTFRDKLNKDGPRKLLALDGGGIRGVLTIEVLAEIESMLRRKLNRDDDFVLADYFDYIAGTSTGAIIGVCLSLGMSVSDIRKFYVDNGVAMFDRAALLDRFLHHKFEDRKLAEQLQKHIGADTTLGSEKLRTLLMMVMRNATTDSPWPVSNNPDGKYNDCARPDCNLNIPLWRLVRASTAAPVFFPPELVSIGAKDFIFVDGGITVYNNPAFHLFLMSTVQAYKLGWPAGEDRMLVVSVGTGMSPDANDYLNMKDMNLIYNAKSLAPALMFAALNEQDFLCRVFGKCLVGDPLDRELGDLIGERGPASPKLFTYLRYNAELTRKGLDALGLQDIEPEDVQKLDSVEHIGELQSIGKEVAKKVEPEHFAGFWE